MLLDYHMHSDFSADCNTSMEETAESAIKKGITEICFTEHVDLEYPDPTISFELDMDKYDKKIKEMQEIYKERLTIKKGIEIGVQPYLLKQYEQLLEGECFDFIICSVHTADRKELHYGSFFEGRTPMEAYKLYYEELLYCVKHFKRI